MMTPAIIFLLAAAADPKPLTLRPRATVHNDRILLADIADLSALPEPMRSRAARLELTKFNGAALPARIATGPLISRARSRLPLLAHWLPATFPSTIALEASRPNESSGQARFRGCVQAVKTVMAGTFPAASAFVDAPCPPRSVSAAFVYDAERRSAKVRRSIAEGEVVRRSAAMKDNSIQPGETMLLVSEAGPVRIERRVEALQAARKRQKLFVRTQDGDVLSVRLDEVLR